jgi:hypothetical protein
MSRGLSEQQRRILGLGVRINRAVNGGQVVPIPGEPEKVPGYRCPLLCSPGLPEITARYVLHLLHGVPIAERLERGSGFFSHDAHTQSLKASVTRAITSLLNRDHVAITHPRARWPGREAPCWTQFVANREWWDAVPEAERLAAGWGYALRPAGIEVGLANEPTDLALSEVLAGVRRLQHGSIVSAVLDKHLEALPRLEPRTKRHRKAHGPRGNTYGTAA